MPEKSEKTSKSAPKSTKVFDIAKPGKLPAAGAGASSRPVIVTNRPIMQDPMMVNQSASGSAPTLSKPTKTVIKPLTDEPEASESAAPLEKKTHQDADVEALNASLASAMAPKDTAATSNDADESADKPSPDSTRQPEPAPEREAEAAKPGRANSDDTSAQGHDASPQDADSKPADPPPPGTPAADQAAEEARIKQQEEIEKMIADKTYVLPINSVGRHRSKVNTMLLLLLAILLGAVLAVLMLDAGFITIPGVEPFTDFF